MMGDGNDYDVIRFDGIEQLIGKLVQETFSNVLELN